MIELLRAAAASVPGHPAIITPTRTVTYRDLLAMAESGAAQLRRRGIDRFAILEPDPATVWALLAAASLAGAEACVYPLAAPPEDIARLRTRFAHEVLVTCRPTSDGGGLAPGLILAGPAQPEGVLSDPRPLLSLTTGTSGEPKAARNDWSRLLRVTEKMKPTPQHRWLLAFALNQFGGLQILLHVAAAQATLIAAKSFQPRDGLAAMRAHKVTHASGTPTFWRFLLTELRADGGSAPPLRQVTLSGEAVPAGLLERLRSQFPSANISQIFGATEMGQTITVRDGRAGLPCSFLDEGGDVVFKVVDGELFVRAASSMFGYVGQREDAIDGFRPTGDLVEVAGDRIVFRGRKSEVINVGGVKVHPLPIEDRVSMVDGVAAAHAYGRPNPMVGQIVAVEVVPMPGADIDDLRARIRSACDELPPAHRPRSIKIVDELKISGNKISRMGQS